MKTVFVPEYVDECGLHFLESRGYSLKRGSGIREDEIAKGLHGCEAVIVRVAPVTEKIMAENPQLKVIGKHGVGVDSIDVEAASRRGIRIVNTPGANSNSVAEHTFALMLALARQLKPLDNAVKLGDYTAKNRYQAHELTGKTLSLVGIGRIGSILAEKAHAFGMNIVAFDPYAKSFPSYVERVKALEDLLPRADVVSIHSPLTPETRGMIGEREFSLMKHGVMLLNCARGAVVDHEALVNALESGKVCAAGLDATEPEQLPIDHPLLRMSNVIVTPHSGAASLDALRQMSMQVCMDIDNVLSGRAPEHPIN